MPKHRFTKSFLESLTPDPSGKVTILFDAEQPALGVRLSKTGGAKLIAQYRVQDGTGKDGKARQVKVTLGPVAELIKAGGDVDKWRQRVGELRAEGRMGRNAAKIEEPPAPVTFAQFADEWLVTYKPTQADGGRQAEIAIDRAKKAWGHKAVADVTPADVRALRDKVRTGHGPAAANRLHAMLSVLFRSAVEHRLINERPTSIIERLPQKARTEVFAVEQMPRLLAGIDKAEAAADPRHSHGVPPSTIAACLKLIVMSGCRKGEAFAAEWSDFNDDLTIWKRRQPKTASVVEVPLMPSATKLLREQRQRLAEGPLWSRNAKALFPSPKSESGKIISVQRMYKQALSNAQLPKTMRVHDLRRTFANTLIYTVQLSPIHTALLTGHSSTAVEGSNVLLKHYGAGQGSGTDPILIEAVAKLDDLYHGRVAVAA